MFKSNTFGRAFWLDDDNEFVSCPLFNNNEDLLESDITELKRINAQLLTTKEDYYVS